MSGTTTPLGTAAEILAAAGVEEDSSFYGPFTDEADKAVLTVPMRIVAAWAARDPDTFADIFTDNASLLMPDNELTGRAEIRAYIAAGFQGPLQGTRVTGWPLYVKYLTPAVAIVVTQGGMLMAGDTEIALERQVRTVWVIVSQDGQWKLLSHQNCPIKGQGRSKIVLGWA